MSTYRATLDRLGAEDLNGPQRVQQETLLKTAACPAVPFLPLAVAAGSDEGEGVSGLRCARGLPTTPRGRLYRRSEHELVVPEEVHLRMHIRTPHPSLTTHARASMMRSTYVRADARGHVHAHADAHTWTQWAERAIERQMRIASEKTYHLN